MNDDVQPPDTPSDELVAVSAVLDGTATPDERALVEASAELTQLLDEVRSARDAVRAVDPAPQARESGIAAALAAFDELHTAPVAPVIQIDRRRRWYSGAMAAAAALIVVVIGAAALEPLGGSDSDQSETASFDTSAKTAQQSNPLDAPAAELPAAAPDADGADAGGTEAPAATDSPAAEADSVLAATQDSSAPDATTSAAATVPTSTIGTIDGPASSGPAIDDPDALAAFAAAAPIRELATDECVPADEDDLGQITYAGTPAVVGRDPDSGTVTAYDLADCSELVTTPG